MVGAGAVAAIVFFFALGYDHALGGPSPLVCALHIADCSTALATWVLCGVTIGTIATGFAVFALETKSALATFSCDHYSRIAPVGAAAHAPAHGEPAAPDANVRERHVYVVRRFERVKRAGQSVYQEHRVPQVRLSPTAGAKYVEYTVDVENLGRSPLIDLYVALTFQRIFAQAPTSVTVQLPLGALGDKKALHLSICIEASLKPREVAFNGRASDDGLAFSYRVIHQPERRREGNL